MDRLRAIYRWIGRHLAFGQHLEAAIVRHDRAADDLDAAVKEVLGR